MYNESESKIKGGFILNSLFLLQSAEEEIFNIYDNWMVDYYSSCDPPSDPTRSKCHTVVNTIASYIAVHFNEKVNHYSSGTHGWGMTDEYLFDFNAKNESAIHIRGSIKFNAYHPLSFQHTPIEIVSEPLMALEIAKKYTSNTSGFIKYLKDNLSKIDDRIVTKGFYQELKRKK